MKKVLIANRGAIACRIIRTLKRMGIPSVAVFSDADTSSLHVVQADEAVNIGPASAAQSYLNISAILTAARQTGADAIHPGYGFLSENVEFAVACDAAGIKFIGPSPENIRTFGLKHTARELAQAYGVPLAAGSHLLKDAEEAVSWSSKIGFPIILKATAGGGGIGMRICESVADVRDSFEQVARLAKGNFSDGGVFLERYVRNARHIEVQIFGDGHGHVVALGERDCSLQRRNQKVIEETPAPFLPAEARSHLFDSAVKLCAGIRYRSAGTVEFLFDADKGDFFFLEVNTRLQVEHGVTEQVTGVDLVEWMIRGADGDFSFMDTWPGQSRGASIQARLYAEDPGQNYRPSSGTLTDVAFPTDARVDSWIENGSEVSAYYDPLLAKVIVTAPDRPAAVLALQRALDETRLAGLETNLEWLRAVTRNGDFVSGKVSTHLLADTTYTPQTIRVLSGGPSTTVQDYPGRLGYWDVGVPPSGPMDNFAFRLGNRLVGNPEGSAGLEITAAGPTLLFERSCTLCLAGAEIEAALDGTPIANYAPQSVTAGQTLKLGRIAGPGIRTYLLFAGGLDIPSYLGSRSTFTLGRFGGHGGRALAAGDVLRLGIASELTAAPALHRHPELTKSWSLRVLSGPHGAPDFFTPEDVAMIASVSWKVHYNSNRTGIRLIGPKPSWARRDGGQAGLHPSNIHDNPYAIGAIDFTGDMPIVLGPDGPSLGGFVCPFVIIAADLWKIGQLAPGDSLTFCLVDDEEAQAALSAFDASITALSPIPEPTLPPRSTYINAVLGAEPARADRPAVTYRRQGDQNLLIEYGPIVLDIELRIRVHALMDELRKRRLPGIIDMTPGIRSLQLHYDSKTLPQNLLLRVLAEAEEQLGSLDDFEIPSRTIHMPISWRDPAVTQTIEKYIDSVRDDAPWCPDNIEFIRRVNGLREEADLHNIIFDARYLVMGLGDVYLGAPVATPIDPRHRLVTTKYNPARTWTPPNVVGIGGAYMCVYGMEGPGGYQLFGRTLQIWNTYRQTEDFPDGKPWLLRFFDQIRFFEVSHDELMKWRLDFPLGRRNIKIEDGTFRLSDYRAFLTEHAGSIKAFENRSRAAFDAERARWEQDGEFTRSEHLPAERDDDNDAVVIPDGMEGVETPMGGVIWRVNVSPGDVVAAGDTVAIVEAMKMESGVTTGISGTVHQVYVSKDSSVSAGAILLSIIPT